MPIDESELTQLRIDAVDKLELVNITRRDFKEIIHQMDTILLTERTEVIPATPSIPIEYEADGITMKNPAVPATPETTNKVFDVMPIDRNLGNITMSVTRRRGIWDNVTSKKQSLGL